MPTSAATDSPRVTAVLARPRGDRPALAPITAAGPEGSIARVRALSWALDRAYLDPLLGLFLPGVGDVVGAVIGTYTIGVALRLGAHPIIIARMLLNLALDAGLGLIPVVGDLGDVAFRAHRRNLALLTDRAEPRQPRARDWLYVVGALILFLTLMALLLVAVIRLLEAIL